MIGYTLVDSNDLGKALMLGGSCEGGPGIRGKDGDQAFYGAYFRDLDGNKICAFSIGSAAT